MKKFLFALAVGLLSAVPASADEPKPTPAPAPTPVATATTMPSVVYSGSTSTPRRGLLGRLRARTNRGAEVTTTPYSGTVITTPAPATGTGSGTSIPTPMPGTGGSTGGVTKSADGVVTASGTTTTTMMPMTTTMTTSTRTSGQRMGLMARLRARR